MGQGFWCGGPSKGSGGSEGPGHSPTLNEQQHPDRPGRWPGGRVILVLWLGVSNPQHCGTRPLGKDPLGETSVSVSQQEAGRPELVALQGAEGSADVIAMGRQSVCPSVLVGGPSNLSGVLEGPAQLPCLFSRPDRSTGPAGLVWWRGIKVSVALWLRSPQCQVAQDTHCPNSSEASTVRKQGCA